MPLTQQEIDFLAPLVYEGQDVPYTGPATEVLRAYGIFPADVLLLSKAYIIREVTLHPDKGLPFGYASPNPPPPCPWQSREEALRRDQELQEELEKK